MAPPSSLSPAAGVGSSTTSSPTRTSRSVATTATQSQQQQQLDERLSSLLAAAPPHFSVPAYLNLALALPDNADTKTDDVDIDEILQRRMAELALQLQLRTQSCHDEIGRIGAELQAVLPRCAADVGRIKTGLVGMEADARGLLKGMAAAPSRSGDGDANDPASVGGASSTKAGTAPLTTLSTLHALRSNLATTRAILAAASSWDETIQSVPALLSSSNLVGAVRALSSLEAGARALRGMPDGREERAEALAKLRGRTEVLLKPQLLHALKKMDSRLGPLRQCADMYRSLGRGDALREEYVRTRPGGVHRLWFAFAGGRGPAAVVDDAGDDDDDDDDRIDDGDDDNGGGEDPSEGFYDADTGRLPSVDEDESKQQSERLDDDDDDYNNETTPPKPQPSQQRDFVAWLPTWYQSILELLAEERRRARAVFGASAAPAISASVLAECFRPVLRSFAARLASVCPPPSTNGYDATPGLGTKKGSGSLESIAAAYDATTEFLSLAYDQMEAWNVENSNSSNNDGTEGESAANAHSKNTDSSSENSLRETLRLIRLTFLSIASPFFPYQKHLADAEHTHSGEAASVVARDVRSAVGGVAGRTLASFEDAAERLGGLAPFLFPLADAAIGRFELLNCGHNAPSVLSGIDALLSDHASELAIAMGTLSRNATAASSSGGSGGARGGGSGGESEFDEQRVHCALEVLRIAGSFRRDLRGFDRNARDRLRVLVDRLLDPVALVFISDNAGDNNHDGGDLPFHVPDSIDPLEIRAMIAGEACRPGVIDEHGRSIEAPSSVVELRRLTGMNGNKGGDNDALPIFPKSFDAASRLASSCQSFVFDVCSAVPERRLRPMSTLAVWKKDGEFDVDVDNDNDDPESYGILPQPYVTHVGEHMLALVQALEPFASDAEALATANEVMGGVRDAVAVQPWREFVAAVGCGDEAFYEDRGEALTSLVSGKVFSNRFLRGSTGNDDDDDEEEEEEEVAEGEEDDDQDPHSRASAAFCNQWLDAVGSAVAGRILERTMRIPRLGRRGGEHLSADLNYVVNVFAALGVAGHPHPLLGHVAELATMDGAELRDRVRDRKREVAAAATEADGGGSSKILLDVMRGAEARIAYVRGISV